MTKTMIPFPKTEEEDVVVEEEEEEECLIHLLCTEQLPHLHDFVVFDERDGIPSYAPERNAMCRDGTPPSSLSPPEIPPPLSDAAKHDDNDEGDNDDTREARQTAAEALADLFGGGNGAVARDAPVSDSFTASLLPPPQQQQHSSNGDGGCGGLSRDVDAVASSLHFAQIIGAAEVVDKREGASTSLSLPNSPSVSVVTSLSDDEPDAPSLYCDETLDGDLAGSQSFDQASQLSRSHLDSSPFVPSAAETKRSLPGCRAIDSTATAPKAIGPKKGNETDDAWLVTCAERIRNDRVLYRKLLLHMALSRERPKNSRSSPASAKPIPLVEQPGVHGAKKKTDDPNLFIGSERAVGRSSAGSQKNNLGDGACGHTKNRQRIVIRDGFFWKDFPILECILRSHMGEYYDLSTFKRQSKAQQSFNNRLVVLVRHKASQNGWVFDEDVFDDKKLRDRVRCFFKTLIQNSKKRLKTVLQNPTKKKNRATLRELMSYVCRDDGKLSGTLGGGPTLAPSFQVPSRCDGRGEGALSSCDRADEQPPRPSGIRNKIKDDDKRTSAAATVTSSDDSDCESSFSDDDGTTSTSSPPNVRPERVAAVAAAASTAAVVDAGNGARRPPPVHRLMLLSDPLPSFAAVGGDGGGRASNRLLCDARVKERGSTCTQKKKKEKEKRRDDSFARDDRRGDLLLRGSGGGGCLDVAGRKRFRIA